MPAVERNGWNTANDKIAEIKRDAIIVLRPAKQNENPPISHRRQKKKTVAVTRHQIGTVERALQIFLKLGLVEELPSGAYYMSNIEMLIGQSSTEGERKRRARQAVWE